MVSGWALNPTADDLLRDTEEQATWRRGRNCSDAGTCYQKPAQVRTGSPLEALAGVREPQVCLSDPGLWPLALGQNKFPLFQAILFVVILLQHPPEMKTVMQRIRVPRSKPEAWLGFHSNGSRKP